MATRYECDRCGKGARALTDMMVMVISPREGMPGARDPMSGFPLDRKVDLCRDCAVGFERWLTGWVAPMEVKR
jgi:hypothetical protein